MGSGFCAVEVPLVSLLSLKPLVADWPFVVAIASVILFENVS
jgi:hypothetical protein